MQYNGQNLVKVDGKGKQGFDIYTKYLELYQDGYDLTLDEACNYLECSYPHILRIFDTIQHVRINTTARKLVYLYGKQENIDPGVLAAFGKRILLNRNDFLNFIKKNLIIEQQYMVLELNMLSPYVLNTVNTNLQIYNSRLSNKQPKIGIKSLADFIIGNLFTENEPIRYSMSSDCTIPKKLCSINTVKEYYGYKSNMQAYRVIKKLGAKKYIFDNFVRYDFSDLHKLESDILKLDYQSYLTLNEKGNAIKKIEEHILRHSNKLAKGNLL